MVKNDIVYYKIAKDKSDLDMAILQLWNQGKDSASIYSIVGFWFIDGETFVKAEEIVNINPIVEQWKGSEEVNLLTLAYNTSHKGKKLQIVKWCKQLTGLGLKEAKTVCDRLIF